MRSLRDFGELPIDELAEDYDLVVIDHPHVGMAARSGAFRPLDDLLDQVVLAERARCSVAHAHESYQYGGRQWALAIDVASHVAVARPGAQRELPTTWQEVEELARHGRVLWPLAPTDASCSFLSLMAQLDSPWPGDDYLTTIDIIQSAIELLARFAHLIPEWCLSANPIEVLEELAAKDSTFAYSPMLFGYINYSTTGFRPTTLEFHNVPRLKPRSRYSGILGGAGVAITARCDDLESACAYVRWISGGQCQTGLYFDAGGQPAHLDAWECPSLNSRVNGFFTRTRASLDAAWTRPRMPGTVSTQTKIGALVSGFFRERSSTRRLATALGDLAARTKDS